MRPESLICTRDEEQEMEKQTLPFVKWFLVRKITKKQRKKKICSAVATRSRNPVVSLSEPALTTLCYLYLS